MLNLAFWTYFVKRNKQMLYPDSFVWFCKQNLHKNKMATITDHENGI